MYQRRNINKRKDVKINIVTRTITRNMSNSHHDPWPTGCELRNGKRRSRFRGYRP